MTAQKDTGEPSPPREAVDHYRLLQLDPDAPHELVIEAYWYAVGRLQAEPGFSRSAERQLDALSTAYATLVIPEDRRSYDASEPRVTQLQRARAELKGKTQRRPLLSRLLGRPPARRLNQPLDYYAILCVDPAADPPLIARAYSVLRTLHLDGIGADQSVPRSMTELEEAHAVLLDPERRAAYDLTRSLAAQRQENIAVAAAEPEAAAPLTVQPSPPGLLAEPSASEQARGERREWARRAELLLRSVWQAILAAYGHARPWALHTARRLGLAAKRIWSALKRAALHAARWLGLASRRIWSSLKSAARHLAEQKGQRVPALPDDLLIPRLHRDAVAHRAVGPLSQIRKEDATSAPRARLVITTASGQRRVLMLGEQPVTLGTDPTCDVLLETQESTVAPEHARIWRSGSSFVIHSLSSHHRTMIEGRNIAWAVLEDGDGIEIGHNQITFEALNSRQEVPDHLSNLHASS